MNNVIDSFRKKPYNFLSNFMYCRMYYEGETYNSVEHAYQAAKTEDLGDREYIKYAHSPGEAKQRGRKVKVRNDWEEIKLDIMLNLVRRKFKIPKLKRKLLDTGSAKLIEGNWWKGTFWGVYNGVGENHLGKILMKVREELREGE